MAPVCRALHVMTPISKFDALAARKGRGGGVLFVVAFLADADDVHSRLFLIQPELRSAHSLGNIIVIVAALIALTSTPVFPSSLGWLGGSWRVCRIAYKALHLCPIRGRTRLLDFHPRPRFPTTCVMVHAGNF
ncbi:hypothetical protein IE81DRAFT_110493 [Ceraceosorus guamensis]|uniref:Uncharacterized protein n=1 Tax=Ceraceosorus guamensis TaxID=1522189 RepID=A0A316W159_9BASI|nr:hypothetical protein IE81DRAFT_110493 [Ceraceosorus guamensis]PWN42858.1 hypothetical protein IE81DRAFT_110493 [Ceraceosorus guamensis]